MKSHMERLTRLMLEIRSIMEAGTFEEKKACLKALKDAIAVSGKTDGEQEGEGL